MHRLDTGARNFKHSDSAGYATAIPFQLKNRPSGNCLEERRIFSWYS